MRLNSHTVLVIHTALVALASYGCWTGDWEGKSRIFEYRENQLDCIYDERNDDLASTLRLRSGAYKMNAPTWSSLDRAYELIDDTTVLSSGWIADADEYVHFGFFGRKTGDATLEVIFDYLEDDYPTETEPMTPTPYDDLERNSNARERISVDLGDWADFNYRPTPPDWADAVALHLIKKGKGTVSLARLVLDYSGDYNRNRKGFENMDGECEANDDCGDALECGDGDTDTEADAEDTCPNS